VETTIRNNLKQLGLQEINDKIMRRLINKHGAVQAAELGQPHIFAEL